ncbi:MAG: PQQ-binding-like beta-propeller repeat protein [Bryobacteraceae bacterium]
MKLRATFVLGFWLHSLEGQVSHERILQAAKDPGNWLTYSGNYLGWRYSPLDQINRENVGKLKVKWIYQMPTTHVVETTPLVVDGVMYFSEPPSNVVAVDAETGKQFWRYRRALPPKINVCCGQVNRQIAVLGDRVFVGTVDAHLLALDARTGDVLWDVEVADYRTGHSITAAPLVVKDMVISGISGGEYGVLGFLAAYDAKSGKRIWRFWTVTGTGEPGTQTWSGNSWKTGGGPTWVTELSMQLRTLSSGEPGILHRTGTEIRAWETTCIPTVPLRSMPTRVS